MLIETITVIVMGAMILLCSLLCGPRRKACCGRCSMLISAAQCGERLEFVLREAAKDAVRSSLDWEIVVDTACTDSEMMRICSLFAAENPAVILTDSTGK